MVELILASKSKVRKEILDKNKILSQVKPSNVDEDSVKNSLLKNNITPEIIELIQNFIKKTYKVK